MVLLKNSAKNIRPTTPLPPRPNSAFTMFARHVWTVYYALDSLVITPQNSPPRHHLCVHYVMIYLIIYMYVCTLYLTRASTRVAYSSSKEEWQRKLKLNTTHRRDHMDIIYKYINIVLSRIGSRDKGFVAYVTASGQSRRTTNGWTFCMHSCFTKNSTTTSAPKISLL